MDVNFEILKLNDPRRESDKNIMNLDDEYVMYAWHRILTLLNDLNEIQNPGNFLTAFQGKNEFSMSFFVKILNFSFFRG